MPGKNDTSSDAPRGATIPTDRARELAKAWGEARLRGAATHWVTPAWPRVDRGGVLTMREHRHELPPVRGVSVAELADLLAWARARMAAEVAAREHLRKCDELGAKMERTVGAPVGSMNPGNSDGLADDDREALAHAVMVDLGLEGPDGEHGTAWTLCERAGWPGLTTEQARAEAQAWAEWRRWADRRKAAGDYEAEFEGDWDPHDDDRGAALESWVRSFPPVAERWGDWMTVMPAARHLAAALEIGKAQARALLTTAGWPS